MTIVADNATFQRDRPLDTGYTMVPHGLWTLPVSCGARNLLGWLHSHTDQFLAGVTENYARKVLATSSVPRWLDELVEAGFLRIHTAENGKRSRIELLMEPWLHLHRPSNRAEVGAPTDEDRAETGAPTAPKQARSTAPISARIEEHSPEDHGEDHSRAPVVVLNSVQNTLPTRSSSSDEIFAQFWRAYPRKVGKPAAQKAWKAVMRKRVDPEVIADGLRRWCLYWSLRDEPEFIPHPSTFLNQERWNDEPDPPPQPKRYEAPGMGALRRRAAQLGVVE